MTVVLLFSNSLFSQEQDYQFDFIPNKSSEEPRILKILIAADQGYQEWVGISNWQEEITRLIDEASRYLEIQAGIKLEITVFETWQRITSGRQYSKTLLTELFQAFPKTEESNFDIVVGLTPDSTGHGAAVHLACILINCMHSYVPNGYNKKICYWLSAVSRAKIFPSVILHELGHIFGCEDKKDDDEKQWVMYGYAGGYSMIFCPENIEIIKNNKWRKFMKIK